MTRLFQNIWFLLLVTLSIYSTAQAADSTVYHVRLTGAEANACDGNDTPNWGYGIVTLSPDSSTLHVYMEHTVIDPIVAHVHQAPRCIIGPPRFFIPDATSPIDVSFAMESYDVDDLLAGDFYLLVHSNEFTAGEIRGQVEDGILVCGDASGDDNVNVGDVVYLINYVFKGGLPPIPNWTGDANCDLGVNVGDAVYLINFIFNGGPPPSGECCP